jgi:hypothetical protein
MQANQRVSGLGATYWLLRLPTARYSRFTLAEDAERGNSGLKPSGIRGMSD